MNLPPKHAQSSNLPKPKKLTVTFPDGTKRTRLTTRGYTHVTAGIRRYSDGTQKWVVWHWCLDEYTARKKKPISGVILLVNGGSDE